jgi:uncharacterized protein YndB with AHSA1/START domain
MASTYTVERSRMVSAPVDRVYPLVADFRQWTRWSPWEDVDPDLQRAYGGAESGVGATYSWSGNRKAGTGHMEILRAEENQHLDIQLTFEKPFRSTNTTSFEFAARGDTTLVTWRMVGPRPLVMRLLGPLMNMDKMLGKDFDKGLGRMDLVAGAPPA